MGPGVCWLLKGPLGARIFASDALIPGPRLQRPPQAAAMFAAGAAAGDWALRRILKFVLKRSLRHIIKTQIDLEQLNVQLGQGTLELREVLLNTNFLNQHLVRGGRQGRGRQRACELAAPMYSFLFPCSV